MCRSRISENRDGPEADFELASSPCWLIGSGPLMTRDQPRDDRKTSYPRQGRMTGVGRAAQVLITCEMAW